MVHCQFSTTYLLLFLNWLAKDLLEQRLFKQALLWLLGPFHGAVVVPSVTRCRRRGHRTLPAL